MKRTIVAGYLFVFPAIAMAAPFQNGSFEESQTDPGNATYFESGNRSITGWTVLSHSIDYIGKENAASEGSRSIDLVGNKSLGGIAQTFDTLRGATYQMTFAMSGNPIGPPPIKIMTVIVGTEGRKFVFDAAGKSFDRMGWTDYQMAFVAQEDTTTIQFIGDTVGQGCCSGPMLDNVRIVAIASCPPKSDIWKYLFFAGLLLAVGSLVLWWIGAGPMKRPKVGELS